MVNSLMEKHLFVPWVFPVPSGFESFPGGSEAKNPSVEQETRVRSFWEDPLEKEVATCSSVLA